MKKALSMGLALGLAAGCFSGAGITAAAEGTSDYVIGVLAPEVTHGWVAAVAYYAETRCKEMKESGEIKDYIIATSGNAEDMTADLDDLLTQNVDAIVAYPQWDGMEASLQRILDADIPLVCFDLQFDLDGYYLVTGDNKDMGVQGANYIFDKIGADGTVIALTVPTAGSVNDLRMEGFYEQMEQLEQNWNVVEYATEFTREAGLKDVADILVNNPQIDAIYSLDDETSIGALQAIKEAGRTDIKVITGGGGCQEYFNIMPEYEDINVASATYSPAMVETAVDEAVQLLNGESVEEKLVIPTTIVDKENYKDFLDPSSPY
mgnify:FL=1